MFSIDEEPQSKPIFQHCDLKNGYYQIEYDSQPYKSIFNAEVVIHNNTLTYHKTMYPTQCTIEWLSKREFNLKSDILSYDTIGKKPILRLKVQLFEIVGCTKDTIDFIEKNAIPNVNGEYINLKGKFILIK